MAKKARKKPRPKKSRPKLTRAWVRVEVDLRGDLPVYHFSGVVMFDGEIKASVNARSTQVTKGMGQTLRAMAEFI